MLSSTQITTTYGNKSRNSVTSQKISNLNSIFSNNKVSSRNISLEPINKSSKIGSHQNIESKSKDSKFNRNLSLPKQNDFYNKVYNQYMPSPIRGSTKELTGKSCRNISPLLKNIALSNFKFKKNN